MGPPVRRCRRDIEPPRARIAVIEAFNCCFRPECRNAQPVEQQRTGARRPDKDLHDALTDIRENGRIPRSQRSPMLCQCVFQHQEETRKPRFYRSKRLDRRRGPARTKERTVRGRSGVREPRANQPKPRGRSNSANWRSSGLGSGKS